GPAAWVAGGDAAERLGDRRRELARAVEQQPARRPGPAFARERRAQLRLGLRADTGHLLEASFVDRGAQLVRRADAERAPELDRAFRTEPEEAAEPDELRLNLALEVAEADDLAALDELLQHRRDARPDSAQREH